MAYQAPLNDMQFVLDNVFKVGDFWANNPTLAETIDMDTATAILDEAAKVAGEVIAPINYNGHEEGVSLKDGVVTTPKGYKEAFATYGEGGWVGFSGDVNYGGMGMPKTLGTLVDEMVNAASNAFALYPGLTSGACLCLAAHGSEELKSLYLPKMYAGEWSGAMDLTEPHAGSDLGNIRTKAVPQADGTYKVSGTKIFITGGDHDLTDNVIHLVLAKLPDAPAGSRGISLFLVPKIKVNADGSLGEANGVKVGSIEHKMGINASATCVMNYDEAEGYLVGELNRGLLAMFTMMNYERIGVGLQGLGVSESAYQMAVTYAKDRLQGKAGSRRSGNASDAIIEHGDVRRMLLEIAATTEAGRALAMYTSLQADIAKFGDGDEAKKATVLQNLLVPVVKAFLTDRGFDNAVTAQQVFGGHGFIRESGIEQLVRDVRIAQIYEGTNGIQALDLLGRKVMPRDGEALALLQSIVQADLQQVPEAFKADADRVLSTFEQLLSVARDLRDRGNQADAVSASAVDYLDALGYTLYGYLWLKMVKAAEDEGVNPDLANRKNTLAKFYFARVFPKVHHHLTAAMSDEALVMGMDNELF